MQLAARTGVWSPSGDPLPYLRRVEYLESHGTEYIDTMITNDDGIDFRIELECTTESSVRRFIFGDTNTTSKGRGYVERNTSGNLAGTHLGQTHFALLTRYVIECKNGNMTLDDGTGDIKTLSTGWVQNTVGTVPNFRIFDINFGGSLYRFIGKLYGFFLSRGGVEVLDLIPVLDLTGIPCMYNEAPLDVPADDHSRFFYNQGTGEFDWGELET